MQCSHVLITLLLIESTHRGTQNVKFTLFTCWAQLLAIRLGPGAAILPKDVKRIHLNFASKLYEGHYGPRKFWRNQLPRLKYHNPAVSMTIERTKDQQSPATMTIFFAPPPVSDSATASPAPTSSTTSSTVASDHTPFDRTETIDMKHKSESEILAKLMKITNAVQVEATPEEEAELEILEDQHKRSDQDRERVIQHNNKIKREKALLAQARGNIEVQQAA